MLNLHIVAPHQQKRPHKALVNHAWSQRAPLRLRCRSMRIPWTLSFGAGNLHCRPSRVSTTSASSFARGFWRLYMRRRARQWQWSNTDGAVSCTGPEECLVLRDPSFSFTACYYGKPSRIADASYALSVCSWRLRTLAVIGPSCMATSDLRTIPQHRQCVLGWGGPCVTEQRGCESQL